MAYGVRPAGLHRRPAHGRLRRARRGPGPGQPARAGARREARQGRALHRLEPAPAVGGPARVRGRRRRCTCWSSPTSSTAAPRRWAAPSGCAEEHVRRYGPDARLVPDPETRLAQGEGRTAASTASDRARAGRAGGVARARGRPPRQARLVGGPRPHAGRDGPPPARRRGRALENERGLPDRIRGADADALLAAIRGGRGHPAAADRPARPRPRCSSASRCSARSARCS